MGKEIIIIDGLELEVYSFGPGKFAYINSGGGCCEIIERRMENDVELLTLCASPLYVPAVDVHLMGCRVKCEYHLRQYFEQQWHTTLEKAIEHKIEHDRKIRAGELVCYVCGSKGARPCPGEGQNLCGRCNTREGINGWS